VFTGVVDGDGGACGFAPTVAAATAMAAALSMVHVALSSAAAANLSKDAAAMAVLFEAAVDLSGEEAVTTVFLEAAAATFSTAPLYSPIF